MHSLRRVYCEVWYRILAKPRAHLAYSDMLLTINRSEQQLLGLHDLEELLKVLEDLDNHLVLRELYIRIVSMRAVVDDAIHVQVQVVDHGHMGAGYGLIDQRVPLTQPSVKFGYTYRTRTAAAMNSFAVSCCQAYKAGDVEAEY